MLLAGCNGTGLGEMDCDIAVVGGGIAGVAIAAHLAEHRTVKLVEMEAQPGFHSTGRSAAIFIDFYGNGVIRALTAASREFFARPPAGFTEVELLRERMVMMIARADQRPALARLIDEVLAGIPFELLTAAQAAALCPILDPAAFEAAVLVRNGADIDVNELQGGYLREFRRRGGVIAISSRVVSLAQQQQGWLVTTSQGSFTARTIVNAAGAWASQIGNLAGAQEIAIVPMRRSAALVEPPSGLSLADWPAVIDIEERFYLKPEGGLLMVSPADETPDEPGDVQPDELDIAIAIDRVQAVSTLDVKRVPHKWAGLRSFVADRSPVVGFDTKVPDFFWLAALGGYGIQTAPALSRLAADVLLGAAPSDACARIGISAEALSPARSAIRGSQPVDAL